MLDINKYYEINNNLYELEISLLQIELTTKCNLFCKHCRGGTEIVNNEINIENIKKAIKLIKNFNSSFSNITLSGGEPFLFSKKFEVLKILKKNDIKNLIITTNGTILDTKFIKEIQMQKFNTVIFSISLDYTDEKKFNEFRGSSEAYKKVMEFLEYISNKNELKSSLRISLSEELINEIELEKFIGIAIEKKCDFIKFVPILPVGMAIKNNCAITKKETLYKFIQLYNKLNKKYSKNIKILTNEPIINIFKDKQYNKTFFIDGCGAGITSFNLLSNGILTPCSLIPQIKILDLSETNDLDTIIKCFKNSNIIKDLILKNYDGKCGKCNFKYSCGGCRARAFNLSKNLLGEDPLCVKAIN